MPLWRSLVQTESVELDIRLVLRAEYSDASNIRILFSAAEREAENTMAEARFQTQVKIKSILTEGFFGGLYSICNSIKVPKLRTLAILDFGFLLMVKFFLCLPIFHEFVRVMVRYFSGLMRTTDRYCPIL